MKSLVSKFLAVALLFSIVSPVGAMPWYDDINIVMAGKRVYKNVLKPYEHEAGKVGTTYLNESEQKAANDLDGKIGFSDLPAVYYRDYILLPYRKFTNEHNYTANGIYYPLLAAAAAGAGYGIYKGAQAVRKIPVDDISIVLAVRRLKRKFSDGWKWMRNKSTKTS